MPHTAHPVFAAWRTGLRADFASSLHFPGERFGALDVAVVSRHHRGGGVGHFLRVHVGGGADVGVADDLLHVFEGRSFRGPGRLGLKLDLRSPVDESQGA